MPTCMPPPKAPPARAPASVSWLAIRALSATGYRRAGGGRPCGRGPACRCGKRRPRISRRRAASPRICRQCQCQTARFVSFNLDACLRIRLRRRFGLPCLDGRVNNESLVFTASRVWACRMPLSPFAPRPPPPAPPAPPPAPPLLCRRLRGVARRAVAHPPAAWRRRGQPARPRLQPARPWWQRTRNFCAQGQQWPFRLARC